MQITSVMKKFIKKKKKKNPTQNEKVEIMRCFPEGNRKIC